jgi:SAM-dependent methyltransferase
VWRTEETEAADRAAVTGMPRDLRRLATGLGLDRSGALRGCYRALASARYFARGYRYARGIRPPQATSPLPASGGANALETYFDEHDRGPGIFKWWHYLEIYDRHLRRFRGQDVTVLEIGVAGGGSLAMWQDYLGPHARVYGVDSDPACLGLAGANVEILIGDQGDSSFWASVLGDLPDIDIVIDDGGHLPHQQVVTLEWLLPRLKPSGVYVCEDIHGPFQPFHAFVDGLTRPLSDIAPPGGDPAPAQPIHAHLASVHRYPILTVIEKSPCAPTAFQAVRRGSEWPPMPGDVRRHAV